MNAETDVELYMEIKELIADLRQMRETKAALADDIDRLKKEIQSMESELTGMDMVMSEISNDIKANDIRAKGFQASIERIAGQREHLYDEINTLHLNVKGVMTDVNNCLTLKTHLEGELSDINKEKALVMNKLKGMEEGINEISKKKAEKLPHLKNFDNVLKGVHNELREIENRMNVSFKFIQYGRY